jgi:hypothetical protein
VRSREKACEAIRVILETPGSNVGETDRGGTSRDIVQWADRDYCNYSSVPKKTPRLTVELAASAPIPLEDTTQVHRYPRLPSLFSGVKLPYMRLGYDQGV